MNARQLVGLVAKLAVMVALYLVVQVTRPWVDPWLDGILGYQQRLLLLLAFFVFMVLWLIRIIARDSRDGTRPGTRWGDKLRSRQPPPGTPD